MAESYVEYLEEQAAHVPSIDVSRLASALDTSVDALSGGAVEVPPGQRGPAPQATLETLDERECRRLLAPGGIGRFVFTTQRGPVAVPVNYRIMDGDIVFRTAEDTILSAVSDAEPVSFEIDRIDDAMSEGWSVLVTGRVRHFSPDQLRRLETLSVQPWTGGQRTVYLLLEPRELTGRRIRAKA
jgi:hypothetical protein